MDTKTLAELKKACKGKRAKFCEEYVVDFQQEKAAIRAGVPEAGAAVQASRFLREPEVLAYRDALIEMEAQAVGVSKNSLIVKADRILQRCMDEKLDAKGAGKMLEILADLEGLRKQQVEHKGGGFEVVVKPREKA